MGDLQVEIWQDFWVPDEIRAGWSSAERVGVALDGLGHVEVGGQLLVGVGEVHRVLLAI